MQIFCAYRCPFISPVKGTLTCKRFVPCYGEDYNWCCSTECHDFLHHVLQEVQSNHFHEFLMPELQKHGYTAVYKKKTTEMYTANKFAIDGCATFFRKDRFALVKKYEVAFHS